MSDFCGELERLYLTYGAELEAVQANITRCEDEANSYRRRYADILNDRAEAVRLLSMEYEREGQ